MGLPWLKPQNRGQMMKRLLTRFVRKEDGATAIEYGLIAAGIAVAIVGTVYLLGDQLDTFFVDILTRLQSRQ
jgi:pilus assembly protein Flp/PilA